MSMISIEYFSELSFVLKSKTPFVGFGERLTCRSKLLSSTPTNKTVTCCVVESVDVQPSLTTVSETLNKAAVWKMCVTTFPVSTALPSPKFQIAKVLSDELAVNTTVSLRCAGDGENVNVASGFFI